MACRSSVEHLRIRGRILTVGRRCGLSPVFLVVDVPWAFGHTTTQIGDPRLQLGAVGVAETGSPVGGYWVAALTVKGLRRRRQPMSIGDWGRALRRLVDNWRVEGSRHDLSNLRVAAALTRCAIPIGRGV